MSADPSFYLFLDLETAGLDRSAPIFEVGCILTEFNGQQFVPLDEYHGIVAWRDDFEPLDEFVRDMHTTNGLLADMKAAPEYVGIKTHDTAIYKMIDEHLGKKWKGKVHLAGSGVSHFDLHRVNDQMPATSMWLHWRPLDVGQLEEWLILTDYRSYEQLVELGHIADAEPKTHRSMDDIRFHLREANWYAGWMR